MSADFKCRARTTNYGDPIDCDWPHCGCDVKATKVVESLIEQGWGDLAAEREACALLADSIAGMERNSYVGAKIAEAIRNRS